MINNIFKIFIAVAVFWSLYLLTIEKDIPYPPECRCGKEMDRLIHDIDTLNEEFKELMKELEENENMY